jgi:iron(III) transport system substrate-binding protein
MRCIARLRLSSGPSFATVYLAILLAAGCSPPSPRVVLYCAQDQEFAEPHFEEFRKQTGLPIAPKYDTEAKKTIGLLTELIAEKNRPRCDVFWNNEPVGTVRLRNLGLLESYDSPAATPYPPAAKAPDHTWYAFAQRARILLVNTKLVAEQDRPKSLLDLVDARWRNRLAMAVPLYGTTASQAACLYSVLGADKSKEYYRSLKANGVNLAPGNKQVAEWVGQGRSPAGREVVVGVTDTDDAMAEVEAGNPVAIIFPDQAGAEKSRLGTLYLPNTLCIMKHCPNPEGARKLVDFLLSPAIEKAVAEGESHQLPMNPEVMARLPEALKSASQMKVMKVDWNSAADHWEEVQAFLAEAGFAGP